MIRKVKATLIETPNGWLRAETGFVYKTAKGAVTALKRDDARAIESGCSTIRTITWETMTPMGRRIATLMHE